ncbi:hypothetical protein MXB_4575 [Myxobolus squamalis]|nr:hypothetical protein MXB_4575 [Myxobolus squamalis]
MYKDKSGPLLSKTILEKYVKLKKLTNEYFYLSRQYMREAMGSTQPLSKDELVEKMIVFLKESYDRHKLLHFALKDTLKSFETLSTSQEGVFGVLYQLNQSEQHVDEQLRTEVLDCANMFKAQSETTKSICVVLETIVDKLGTICERAIQDTMTTADQLRRNYEDKKAEYFVKQKYLEFNRTSSLISALSLLTKSMKMYYSGNNKEIMNALQDIFRIPKI